ncbi:uncharacterized protein EV154DRAFT_484001 [Mucor mucedo]|uniref:uncharacterized protein n=1 Tax=Mucor mucedo TaxID=29922 RepID=UPI00221F738D|nr:uncharacterized protein EV154DRAFT_484001 [Mucor mucedo]KAI7888530.1 hypothetical protein EV154DRAFT_484001 [Mucor mucedo]
MTLLLLYSQVIQAFCVYNKMEGEGVNLLAFNLFVNALPFQIFRKEIGQGEKECCPYKNSDCVAGSRRDSQIELHVGILRFAFDKTSIKENKRMYITRCEGGAAIVLTGSNFDNIECTCYKANGDITRDKMVNWITVMS